MVVENPRLVAAAAIRVDSRAAGGANDLRPRNASGIDRMTTYGLLKILHIVLVLISGLGFAMRGFVRLVLDRPLANPLVRFGPHLVDTLLLASGVALWILLGTSPLGQAWFGAKLALIAGYIVVGIAAFRSEGRGRGILLFLVALALFLAIAWLALLKPF